MTDILILSCASTYIAFWAGMIAWSVRKRMPFPWDIALGLVVISLRSGVLQVTGVSFHLAWLAFFPVMVWPDSKPARYFIQLPQIGRSLVYGLLAGLGSILLLVILRGWEQVINFPITVPGPGVMAFIAMEGVLFEELAFRGLILGSLIYRGFTERTALLLQAALFLIAHFPSYLPDADWASLAVVALTGLLAGWITLRTHNITGAVLMHFIINMSLGLLAYYF